MKYPISGSKDTWSPVYMIGGIIQIMFTNVIFKVDQSSRKQSYICYDNINNYIIHLFCNVQNRLRKLEQKLYTQVVKLSSFANLIIHFISFGNPFTFFIIFFKFNKYIWYLFISPPPRPQTKLRGYIVILMCVRAFIRPSVRPSLLISNPLLL